MLLLVQTFPLLSNITEQTNSILSAGYTGYIPVDYTGSSVEINYIYAIPTLERLGNYWTLFDLSKKLQIQVQIQNEHIANLVYDNSIWSNKYSTLQMKYDTNNALWDARVKKERFVWGASGVGVGVLLSVVVVLLVNNK